MEISKEHIDELVTFVKQTAESGKDFVVTQAPYLVQEIVSWYFWSNVIWSVVWLIVSAFVWYLSRCLYFWPGYKEDLEKDRIPPVHIGGYMLSLFFMLVSFIPTSFAIKACVAPRLVVIEELTKLVQQR